MALGIKKITESVVEDERSLIMLGKYDNTNIVYDDNKAVPLGAVISDVNCSGGKGILRIKSGENQQVRIDANASLYPQSVTRTEIKNNNVLNQHLNATNAKDADRSVANHNIRNNAITQDKIKNHNVLNKHLNAVDAKDADRSVANHNIRDNAITESKIAKDAVTTNKIKNDSVTRNKLAPAVRTELDTLRKDLNTLRKDFESFKTYIEDKIENEIAKCLNNAKAYTNQQINNLRTELKKDTDNKIKANNEKYNLTNVVFHTNYDVLGKKVNGKYTSTPLSDLNCSGNITCSGDINGKRVFFMTYQDLAEAYIPGEQLEAGDIVAIHNDGKVYKAESMNDCIVGVISNEFANCLGASKEELFNGSKVAVGMIGKVHVKVKGPIKLGQYIGLSLSEAGVGCGLGINSMSNGIGKALEEIDCDFDEIHEVLVQIRPM